MIWFESLMCALFDMEWSQFVRRSLAVDPQTGDTSWHLKRIPISEEPGEDLFFHPGRLPGVHLVISLYQLSSTKPATIGLICCTARFSTSHSRCGGVVEQRFSPKLQGFLRCKPLPVLFFLPILERNVTFRTWPLVKTKNDFPQIIFHVPFFKLEARFWVTKTSPCKSSKDH